jgi:predicted nucleic acid-binding protein
VKYLLDTNVLSELRKGRRTSPNVRKWFNPIPTDNLYISVLVLGEIRKGVESIGRKDPAQAAALERWLAEVLLDFAGHVLPITDAISDRWGRLAAPRPLPTTDGLMAATALTHSLTFVTRNTLDIQHTGVSLLNPF